MRCEHDGRVEEWVLEGGARIGNVEEVDRWVDSMSSREWRTHRAIGAGDRASVRARESVKRKGECIS